MNKATLILSAGLALLTTQSTLADMTTPWYVKTNLGLSQLSDVTSDTANIVNNGNSADISLDSGFTTGLGLGYRITPNASVEFSWEYRTNDSEVTINDTFFPEGNFASNIFFLNGIYEFQSFGQFTPFVGAGLSWMQEIDIDLETNGVEQSYSGDGDIGYQLLTGINSEIAQGWLGSIELRYQNTSDIDLDNFFGAQGNFTNIDYDPITLQATLSYDFSF